MWMFPLLSLAMLCYTNTSLGMTFQLHKSIHWLAFLMLWFYAIKLLSCTCSLTATVSIISNIRLSWCSVIMYNPFLGKGNSFNLNQQKPTPTLLLHLSATNGKTPRYLLSSLQQMWQWSKVYSLRSFFFLSALHMQMSNCIVMCQSETHIRTLKETYAPKKWTVKGHFPEIHVYSHGTFHYSSLWSL